MFIQVQKGLCRKVGLPGLLLRHVLLRVQLAWPGLLLRVQLA
jgi:hypothetical protein